MAKLVTDMPFGGTQVSQTGVYVRCHNKMVVNVGKELKTRWGG